MTPIDLALAIFAGISSAGWASEYMRRRELRTQLKLAREEIGLYHLEDQYRQDETLHGKQFADVVRFQKRLERGPYYDRHVAYGDEHCDGWDPDRCQESMCKDYETCATNGGRDAE